MLKRMRYLFLFALLLAIPAMACAIIAGDEPTQEAATVPPATEAPQPTATSVPATATDTPAPTTTPEQEEPTRSPAVTNGVLPTLPSAAVDEVNLADSSYTHPQNLFSLVPPAGWEITDEDGSTSIEAPDGSGFIYVQVTNTGHALDDASFTSFVGHRDLNFFSGFDDYTELSQEVDTETDIASVTKSVSFEGIPQTIITVYDQYDAIIYSYDFWTDEDNFEAYSDLYSRLIDTIEVNPDAGTEQVVYNWIYTFTGPMDLFTIEVPTPWRYEQTEGESAIVDTFYAPDEHAVIQNIAYDEGQEISRSEAGAFALELLRSYYADDIQILDDQLQPDGSERLIWTSPSGDYSGTSFLETRGTTFLLFTTMYDNPYEDVYLETLNYTIDTYEVPEE